MKVYFISKKNSERSSTTARLFEEACHTEGADFVTVFAEGASSLSLPSPEKGDAVLREATGSAARRVERSLLSPQVAHLYSSYERSLLSYPASFVIHEKLGLPIIPTHYINAPVSRTAVREIAGLLGFPLVLKIMGGMKGVGIIQVDSLEGLFSLTDYLCAEEKHFYIRKYVPHGYAVRAVVVGSRIAACYRVKVGTDEFRANVATGEDERGKREVYHCAPELERIILQSVQVMGYELGGVDILLGEDGNFYISEINFPCDLSIVKEVTGIDIPREIVRRLKEKGAAILAEANET